MQTHRIRNTPWKILTMLAVTACLGAVAQPADEFVPGELLVGFRPGTRAPQAEAARHGLGADRLKAWPEIAAEHWRLPANLGIAQAIRALEANPNVLYAEPNYRVHGAAVPNDPLRADQWNLHNVAQAGGMADADVDAPEAWAVRTDASPVVVGVVDSGVDYNHPDLAANIWTNPGEMGTDAQGRNMATNGIDDDANGRVDDFCGWNFVNNSNNPFDGYSHGTHVSGTIGAVGNNGLGVAGVAWRVKLMPLKILDDTGTGSTAAATDAINYAAKFVDAAGRKIVQITSHSYVSGTKSKTLESAIKNCNALVVAAAGNAGNTTVQYPAAYPQPNVVAVAATDSSDALASFSNRGFWVHVAAPGVSILSTLPNNNYGYNSGTSMATPHVSGVAALVLAQNPGLSVASLRAQVLGTVDVVPGLAGLVTTGGRLNARKALGTPEAPTDTTAPTAIGDLAATAISPNSVSLSWTAPDEAGSSGAAYCYEVRYSMNPISTEADFALAAKADGEPIPQTGGVLETFTIDDLPDNRPWYFAIKSIDLSGNVSALSNPASAVLQMADWFFVGTGRLDGGADMGTYASVGVLPDGYWAVAYDDRGAGMLKCARLLPPGAAYRKEPVMAGGFGPSLAYNTLAEITISHVDASKRLWFVVLSGETWTSTQVAANAYPHETSLAYVGADPVISYYSTARRASGLSVARRVGSTWSTQLVDPGALAFYNQVAVDSAGNPWIAYSYDNDGNGSVDRLKLAHWNGTLWEISVVDAGGLFGTLALDPTTGYPAVAHWNATSGELRFRRWTGSDWATAEIVEKGTSIKGCSFQFGPDGKAYLAYGSDSMRLAIRDAASGVWTVEAIEEGASGSLRNSISGRPGMTPSVVAFRGPAEDGFATTMRLALRRTPY